MIFRSCLKQSLVQPSWSLNFGVVGVRIARNNLTRKYHNSDVACRIRGNKKVKAFNSKFAKKSQKIRNKAVTVFKLTKSEFSPRIKACLGLAVFLLALGGGGVVNVNFLLKDNDENVLVSKVQHQNGMAKEHKLANNNNSGLADESKSTDGKGSLSWISGAWSALTGGGEGGTNISHNMAGSNDQNIGGDSSSSSSSNNNSEVTALDGNVHNNQLEPKLNNPKTHQVAVDKKHQGYMDRMRKKWSEIGDNGKANTAITKSPNDEERQRHNQSKKLFDVIERNAVPVLFIGIGVAAVFFARMLSKSHVKSINYNPHTGMVDFNMVELGFLPSKQMSFHKTVVNLKPDSIHQETTYFVSIPDTTTFLQMYKEGNGVILNADYFQEIFGPKTINFIEVQDDSFNPDPGYHPPVNK